MIRVALILMVIISGCKVNEPPILPEPPLAETPQILWQVPLRSDTLVSQCMVPILYQDRLIVSADPYYFTDAATMKMVDTTGQIIWDSEIIGTVCEKVNHRSVSGNFIQDGILVYLCKSRPAAINAFSGYTLWEYPSDPGISTMLQHFENSIFYSSGVGGSVIPYDTSLLYIVDIATGARKEVFRLGRDGDYSAYIYPPAVHVNSDGDTILYFQNRQWNFVNSGMGGRVDLYCYNMTGDSIIWKIPQIDPYGNSSVCLPLYHEGKLYFRGLQTLFCLDASNGEILWSHEFPGDFDDILQGNMLMVEDMLLLKSSTEGLHAFNPQTGELLWERYDAGNTSCYMTYHEGAVYYGSYDGKIFKVRVRDGEIMWTYSSPNAKVAPTWDAVFYNSVTIDPLTNRMYACDAFYLMCLQLP